LANKRTAYLIISLIKNRSTAYRFSKNKGYHANILIAQNFLSPQTTSKPFFASVANNVLLQEKNNKNKSVPLRFTGYIISIPLASIK
jgi:hypothetical protein